MAEIRDLGWVNGWSKTPEIVQSCRDLREEYVDDDHALELSGVNRGVQRVTCDTCGYTYQIDSGG